MSININNKKTTYDVNEITSNFKYVGTCEEIDDIKISIYLNIFDLDSDQNIGNSIYYYDDLGRVNFTVVIDEEKRLIAINEILTIVDEIKSKIGK